MPNSPPIKTSEGHCLTNKIYTQNCLKRHFPRIELTNWEGSIYFLIAYNAML